MPIAVVPENVLASAAHRAVRRAITSRPPMAPAQIASVVRVKSRQCDVEGLRDLIEEQIEVERRRSSHWSFSQDRLLALRHALVSTDAVGFADDWNAWRGA